MIEICGRFGYNVIFLIEMVEEMGLVGFVEFCVVNWDFLVVDFLIVLDGLWFLIEGFDIKFGMCGGLNICFWLDYCEGGYYLGNWGGLLVNLVIVLMYVFIMLVSCSGEMLYLGLKLLYIKNLVCDVFFSVIVMFGLGDLEIDFWWGELGLSSVEKVFGWNIFEVLFFIIGDLEKL